MEEHRDGGYPPINIVAEYIIILQSFSRAVAVRSASGLGRAGKLVGLYLMKHHEFTAREGDGLAPQEYSQVRVHTGRITLSSMKHAGL